MNRYMELSTVQQINWISRLPTAALSLLAGALVVGCEPQQVEDADAQLNREQQTTRQREGLQERERAQAPQTSQSSRQAAPARDVGGSEAPDPARSSGRQRTARAVLAPTEGNRASGVVEFATGDNGRLTITAMVNGLEPRRHGFHVHQNGDCSGPNAESAGDHFNPGNDPHGGPEDAAGSHHAGDLGNVTADANGMAAARIEDEELALEGELGVVGRAVIVHAGPDDLQSQPSGGAGDPVACGVIRMSDTPGQASTG